MSPIYMVHTAKLSDKKIIELLNALDGRFGKKSSFVKLGKQEITDYQSDESKELFANKKVKVITSAQIITSLDVFRVNYNRVDSSRYQDEIVLEQLGINHSNRNQRAASPEELVECLSIVQKFVSDVLPLNDAATDNATELLQAQIERLSETYEDMIMGIDRRRAELDSDHDSRMKLLEEQSNERMQEIESQKQKAEESYAKKLEELERRKADLDDRDHMHVRREQREQISDDVKTRLKEAVVPASAGIMRYSVFLIACSIAMFLGFVSYAGVGSLDNLLSLPAERWELSPENSVIMWFLLIKTTLSSLGTVFAAFYAVSWLRRMYFDDVSARRDLERYAYDINRASWAIETIMEMQSSKGATPPSAWIDATCKNLFDSQRGGDEHAFHPIEAILSSSAKVEFGPDGARFELGKRGAKQLAKQVSNSC